MKPDDLMAKLKPCPKCGSTNLMLIVDRWSGKINRSIMCRDCEYVGGLAFTDVKVVKRWNAR